MQFLNAKEKRKTPHESFSPMSGTSITAAQRVPLEAAATLGWMLCARRKTAHWIDLWAVSVMDDA